MLHPLCKLRQDRQLVREQVMEGAPAEPKPAAEPPLSVKKSKEELSQMSIHDLKGILNERHIDMTGVAEKGELVQLVLDRCT
jgi:hypothetical protein